MPPYPSDMLKFNSFISTKYEIDSILLINMMFKLE